MYFHPTPGTQVTDPGTGLPVDPAEPVVPGYDQYWWRREREGSGVCSDEPLAAAPIEPEGND